MLKAYPKHGPTQAFGLICSPSANSVFDGRHAYVPALEDVLVWDVKKGQMTAMWHDTGHREEVTCILNSPRENVFAVGYADGSVRLWDSITSNVLVTFNGHKKAITALAFDESGSRIASGSLDTNVILWDIEAEAGLFRLRGHRGPITALRFLWPSQATSTTQGFIISSSRDTFLKLWDLTTQHCMQTVIAHQAEVWTLDLDPAGELLLTGSNEGEVKAWSIDEEVLIQGLTKTDSGELSKVIHLLGTLLISQKHRVTQIAFHPSQPYLAILSHDRSIEVFSIRTEDEIKKKRSRRKQRNREKAKKQKVDDVDVNGGAIRSLDDEDEVVSVSELFSAYLMVRASGKVRSFDFVNGATPSKGGMPMLVSTSNNTLEVHIIPVKKSHKNEEPTSALRSHVVDLPGHRTDVRTVCLSSNDELLASGSNGALKIWNMRTTRCIRTLDCDYAICSTFLPGDRHVAVGTKAGDLVIYDLATSEVLHNIKAHSGTLWSMQVKSDRMGMVTGGADKNVKFFDFQFNVGHDADETRPAIVLALHKTLKMTDDVLAVRCSPDGRFIAVALLDSTVKIFHSDTLKFFLSLYGHKLPVLSMDISSDSKLIATCSADKNVKIWGLDFGDCHKSIFAHEDSVMQIAFERNTHYFWTVGKDKWLKYWDGDRFECIQKLDGHHGEIWSLAVSHRGRFVVTGSHDKSIRVWEKTEDQIFLEEERERELEDLYERGVVDSMNRAEQEETEVADDSTAVAKQTSATLMAGEKIMEALELADADLAAMKSYDEMVASFPLAQANNVLAPTRNPVLAAYDLDGTAYVLKVVRTVQSTALHDALLVLPFSKVTSLMYYLNQWAIQETEMALVSRILFFLIRIHHHQIVANRLMRTILMDLKVHLRNALNGQKDEIGYNLAGLKHISIRHDAERVALFYEQEYLDEEKVRARLADGKKRKRITLKA